MKLPNGVNAVIDIEKLRDYCLSEQHPEGRHKARVFLSALEMVASDAGSLQNSLLTAAAESDNATTTGADEYGYRYSLDCTVCWYSRKSAVRSAWIINPDNSLERFSSVAAIIFLFIAGFAAKAAPTKDVPCPEPPIFSNGLFGIKSGEDFPRLTSCYILRRPQ